MNKEEINKSVLNLIYENKIFAKCYKCNNFLCFFEVYNLHCNKCGSIDFDQLIVLNFDDAG